MPEQPIDLEKLAEAIQRQYEKGQPLQSLAPNHRRAWEIIYYQAHQFYKFERYKQAEDLFTLLCMSDPKQERYWLGLGLAQHRQQRYAEALQAYSEAINTGGDNPWCALHSAECHLKTNAYESARNALNVAEIWARGDEDIGALTVRIAGLRKILERRMAKQSSAN